ncbi:hypothetical protein [Bradyrhizobium sp. HKCCYLS2038]|uniref:hypothetical protein n=1 Tax=Bradyrhizobium sp. HKCCYLS2038 TaxID=3420764 RepID=UPI003EBFACD7
MLAEAKPSPDLADHQAIDQRASHNKIAIEEWLLGQRPDLLGIGDLDDVDETGHPNATCHALDHQPLFEIPKVVVAYAGVAGKSGTTEIWRLTGARKPVSSRYAS